jgi:hypothetical protein
MELIDRIKQDIDDRLEELRPQVEEIPRLEAVLAAMGSAAGEGQTRRAGAGSPGRGRRRGAGARRGGAARATSTGPRRRARRGQRREELLQLVAGYPEITIAEAARQMGVSSPQVSTLVRRLEEEGTLKRSDGRFVLLAPAAFAASAGEGAAAANGGEHDGSPLDADESAPPAPEEIQGPGAESMAGEEGIAGAEPARDEAGRPPAT